MSADEEPLESDEEILRVLEALDPVFKRFTDQQVRLFESHLRIRAYVMGAPPEWIEEGRFPPAFVLAALRQTIKESEIARAARDEKREASRPTG